MKGLYWKKRLQQRNLFGDIVDHEFGSSSQVTWLIGDFFEELAIKQIGGKVELYNWKQRCFKEGLFYPDLLDWEREIVFEVKSYGHHYECIIRPRQANNYLDLEKNEFPMTKPPTFYIFFEHRATDIPFEKRNTELTLWKALCKSIMYMVVMPTALVLEMIKDKALHVYKGREGWDYKRIRPKEIRKFLFDPQSHITDEYQEVFRTSRRCKMLKWMTNEFPIRFIWKKETKAPSVFLERSIEHG